MARQHTIQHIRTTRATLDTTATASGLKQGEIYLITDEDRLAVGLSTSTYETYAKEDEAGLTATVSSTLTLVVANWSSETQTLTVTGVTATSTNLVVIESITMGDRWGEAKVYATAQDTDEITFSCETAPTDDIEFKIVILK
jgi:hypothetical protein